MSLRSKEKARKLAKVRSGKKTEEPKPEPKHEHETKKHDGGKK